MNETVSQSVLRYLITLSDALPAGPERDRVGSVIEAAETDGAETVRLREIAGLLPGVAKRHGKDAVRTALAALGAARCAVFSELRVELCLAAQKVLASSVSAPDPGETVALARRISAAADACGSDGPIAGAIPSTDEIRDLVDHAGCLPNPLDRLHAARRLCRAVDLAEMLND